MIQTSILFKIIIRILAVSALLMTLIPSFFHFSGRIESQQVKWWMGIGMVLWFMTGSLWLGRKNKDQ